MEREYIIIRHPLRVKGNIFLLGTKFCNGVAVVAKGSKAHKNLLKCPLLKNHKEMSIDWLPKLGFRGKDIKLVFGKEVAIAFTATMEQIQAASNEVQVQVPETEQTFESKEIELKTEEPQSTLPSMSVEEQIELHKQTGICIAVKPSKDVCKNKITKNSLTGHYCSSHAKKFEI